MAFPYIITAKRDPDDPTGKVYYPKATSYGIIERKTLCADIEKATSLTAGDVQNVVNNLLDILKRYLGLGYKVRLDGVGLFSIGLATTSDQDKTKVTADNIKDKKVMFRPDTALRNEVKQFEATLYNQKG